ARGMSAAQLDRALNAESGLLGVSGVSSDFREVDAAAQKGNERARLALEIFADRVRAAIGALATALGGVDALTFTGGIGENSASLRKTVCDGLTFLGIDVNKDLNNACR